MENMVYDGKEYRLDGANVVDNNTNTVVCTSLAMSICNFYNLVLPKCETETGGRIDTNYLNSLVKNRLGK